MDFWQALILGVVEGITEFLPVSSTGHLTILENLLGYDINAADITAFTAIIQSGAVIATVIFLRQDIWRILTGWLLTSHLPVATLKRCIAPLHSLSERSRSLRPSPKY